MHDLTVMRQKVRSSKDGNRMNVGKFSDNSCALTFKTIPMARKTSWLILGEDSKKLYLILTKSFPGSLPRVEKTLRQMFPNSLAKSGSESESNSDIDNPPPPKRANSHRNDSPLPLTAESNTPTTLVVDPPEEQNPSSERAVVQSFGG